MRVARKKIVKIETNRIMKHGITRTHNVERGHIFDKRDRIGICKLLTEEI